jgi:hypothetical protein
LDSNAHRVSAIDEIGFVETKHNDSTTLWHRSDWWHREYRNLGVNDQAEQRNAYGSDEFFHILDPYAFAACGAG